MFKKLALGLALALWALPAAAQQCPTRPAGDSSNACASTAFVQTAVGGSIILAGTPPITTNLVGSTWTIALTTPLTASFGGTGRSTLTSNAILSGNGTGTVNLIAVGAAGLPLVSNGTLYAAAALGVAGGGTSLTAVVAGGDIYFPTTTSMATSASLSGFVLRNGTSAPTNWGGSSCSAGGAAAIQTIATAGTSTCVTFVGSNITITPSGTNPTVLTFTGSVVGGLIGYADLQGVVGNIPGTRNVFMGGAGNSGVSGADNTGFGPGVFAALTTGTENAVFGCNSTAANAISGAAITTSKNNTIMGCGAGVALTSQAAGALGYNTLIGYGAGMWLQSGGSPSQENVALGVNACNGCTVADGNTALGANAMQGFYLPSPPLGTPITGTFNTSVGYNAHSFVTTGSGNVIIGQNACLSCNTASDNVVIGGAALVGNYDPTGPSGTAITGTKNTVVGYAIAGITTGTYNSFLGAQIGTCAGAIINATIIGARVNCALIGSNEIAIADGTGAVRISANNAGTVSANGGVLVTETGTETLTNKFFGTINWSSSAATKDSAQNVATLTNGSTVALTADPTLSSVIFLVDANAKFCMFILNAGLNTVSRVSDPASVCGVTASAAALNVYKSGADYILQNNSGGTLNYKIRYFQLG